MRALIKGLPPESALSRALSPDLVGWSNNEELLATLIEVLDLNNRLYIQAHSEEHAKPPEPIKIPRPYKKAEEKRPSTPTEVKQFFTQTGVSSNGR